MDKLQGILKGFPPPADAWQSRNELDQYARDHVDAVTKLPDAARVLITSKPKQVLDWLHPARNTISYLAVLDVLLQFTNVDATADRSLLQDRTQLFLANFNRVEVRFLGEALVRLMQRISLNNLFQPNHTTELVAAAILRIDPTGTMFTSTHLLLAKLVLTTGHVEPALGVFDKAITAYPSATSARGGRALSDPSLPPAMYITPGTGLTEPVKVPMVLDYGATLGQIYISRRDWGQASAALGNVITHPAKERGVVPAMATAYKKWVLVGLLETGQTPVLPSYTPSAAKTNYSSHTAYNALAIAFDGSEPTQLQTELTTHGATYEEDGNTGLVREVLRAYQKWQIINLRNTYSRIPVSKIREETFSGETGERLQSIGLVAALIQTMIDSGMLKAEFELSDDGQETYLAFQDDSVLMSEQAFAQEIARRHINIENLTKQYKAANERLGSNKEYVKHVYREQRRTAEEGSQPAGFDAAVEEEDLMTGILQHQG